MKRALALALLVGLPAFAQSGGGLGRVDPLKVADQPVDATATNSGAALSVACTDANINSCGANSTLSIATAGFLSVGLHVDAASTWVGTMAVDCSNNAGTNWTKTWVLDYASTTKVKNWTMASGTGVDQGIDLTTCAGASHARMRLVVVTSGSIATNGAKLRASMVPPPPIGLYRIPTYSCVFRLTTRPYALSATITTNTRVQYATVHHASTAIKTVRIRRILAAIESVSVATLLHVEVQGITAAPATGNPAITPSLHHRSDPAAETTCLSLPTTAGTEGTDKYADVEYNQGITGTAPTANPPLPLQYQEVYSEDELGQIGDVKPIILRALTLEGIAVVFDSSGVSSVVKGYIIVRFTEE